MTALVMPVHHLLAPPTAPLAPPHPWHSAHGPALTRMSASGSCLAPPATSFWPLRSCPSQHPPRLVGILRKDPPEALEGAHVLGYTWVHTGWFAVWQGMQMPQPKTLPPRGEEPGMAGARWGRGRHGPLKRRGKARLNSSEGHSDRPQELTLAWGREAHSLGEGGQHRLLCQPKTQPSAQGPGERAGQGRGLVCTSPILPPLFSGLPHLDMYRPSPQKPEDSSEPERDPRHHTAPCTAPCDR